MDTNRSVMLESRIAELESQVNSLNAINRRLHDALEEKLEEITKLKSESRR